MTRQRKSTFNKKRIFKNRFIQQQLINLDKWKIFNNTEKIFGLQKKYPALKIADVKIKNPDNPAKIIAAKLIHYEI